MANQTQGDPAQGGQSQDQTEKQNPNQDQAGTQQGQDTTTAPDEDMVVITQGEDRDATRPVTGEDRNPNQRTDEASRDEPRQS